MANAIITQQDRYNSGYYEPYLFPDMPETANAQYAETITATVASIYEDNGPMNTGLFRTLSFTSTYQMPIVNPYNGEIPWYLVPHYRLKDVKTTSGVCPCFYTSDGNFERAWNRPRAFSKTLTRYSYVLSPDFSVYLDMPRPSQVANMSGISLLPHGGRNAG